MLLNELKKAKGRPKKNSKKEEVLVVVMKNLIVKAIKANLVAQVI